jgi:sec-independent protein translocase protein TatA
VPFGIGIWEILILLLVVLLVFGPKRLPEMGRSLGRGMREFKDSISGKDDDDEPVHRQQAQALPRVEDDLVRDEVVQDDLVARAPRAQAERDRDAV